MQPAVEQMATKTVIANLDFLCCILSYLDSVYATLLNNKLDNNKHYLVATIQSF